MTKSPFKEMSYVQVGQQGESHVDRLGRLKIVMNWFIAIHGIDKYHESVEQIFTAKSEKGAMRKAMKLAERFSLPLEIL